MTSTTSSTNDDCCAPPADDVCNLPPAQMQDRIAMIRSELLPRATVRRELVGGVEGIEWEFDASPAMRATLDHFVTFERECCSGFEWIAMENDQGALVLRVEGAGAREAFERLVGAQNGSTTRRGATDVRRFAKAAGLGVGGALVLCCVVPVGAAALLGAAAAPLAGLDDPRIIASSALVFGAAAWYIEKRRERAACLRC